MRDIGYGLSGGVRIYARTQKGDGPHTLTHLRYLAPATVELWNGQRWTRVVKWTPVERPADVFELHLRSGERIGCMRADEFTLGDVIDYARLPEPEVVRWPAALPDEDIGWFVGLYMAEGWRHAGNKVLLFAGHERETERFERLSRIATAFDGSCRLHRFGSGHAVAAHVYGPVLAGIIDAYLSGTGAKGKHLSARAWRRSDAFLRALLFGYLEGDGHERKPTFWDVGFTNNDAWAADLRTLSARLGWSLRLKRAINVCNGQGFPGWRGTVRSARSGHFNERPDTGIVKIERSRARRVWDVEVADEPHTFALASGVLTRG